MMKGLTQKQQNTFYFFLSFVFMFHVAFLFSKIEWQSTSSSTPKEETSLIKVKFVPNKVKQQIVETLETNLTDTQVKKTYLGKKNNKVDRETRAQIVGKFNKAGVGKKNGFAENTVKSSVSKNKMKKEVTLKDLALHKKPIDMARQNKIMREAMIAKGLENGDKESKGHSMSNDFVEEVPLGDFTKLNTQEFEFYGFYHRIKDKLEQFWGRNIQEEAEKFYKSGRRMPASNNHITSLVVVLDNKGRIVKVNIKSTSGIKELDNAAVEAFNQAGPFPNPPKGMLKNGKAVVEWGFVVNT